MKRLIIIFIALVAGISLVTLASIGSPPRANAGGLPCFFCHGGNFEGSDIAPRVAGTQLTDGEIIKQIVSPRGVMPAYPDYTSPFVIEAIRAQPTGKPTMAMSAEQRSAALATIASVASARATTVLRNQASVVVAVTSTRAPASATPFASSTPLATPTVVVSASVDTAGRSTNTSTPSGVTLPLGIFVVSALVTIVVVGLSQRQKGAPS